MIVRRPNDWLEGELMKGSAPLSDDERAELERKGELLSNLLAVIHGDGGHYEAEHGTAKAVEDAITRVINTKSSLDEAEFDSGMLDGGSEYDGLTDAARGAKLVGKKKKTRR